MKRRTILGATALNLLMGPGKGFAQAPSYPTKPIKITVPYPAGGATDAFARTVFTKAGELIGQSMVIENRPGASSTIGAEYVARSPADGYNLLFSDFGTYVLNPSLFKRLRYDPKADYAPISLGGRIPVLLIVNPSVLPVTNSAELVAAAKRAPGTINYGAPGPGAPIHMAMELYKYQQKIDMVAVPYKGGADALNDLIGGQVHAMFLDIASALPHLTSGKLRAIGIASPKRNPALPDVPTIAESGLPGFEAYIWNGFSASSKTPPGIVKALNTAFVNAVNDPSVQQWLKKAYIEPIAGTPEAFASYMAAETPRWREVIKAARISLD